VVDTTTVIQQASITRLTDSNSEQQHRAFHRQRWLQMLCLTNNNKHSKDSMLPLWCNRSPASIGSSMYFTAAQIHSDEGLQHSCSSTSHPDAQHLPNCNCRTADPATLADLVAAASGLTRYALQQAAKAVTFTACLAAGTAEHTARHQTAAATSALLHTTPLPFARMS
jgi:hypothetical protein